MHEYEDSDSSMPKMEEKPRVRKKIKSSKQQIREKMKCDKKVEKVSSVTEVWIKKEVISSSDEDICLNALKRKIACANQDNTESITKMKLRNERVRLINHEGTEVESTSAQVKCELSDGYGSGDLEGSYTLPIETILDTPSLELTALPPGSHLRSIGRNYNLSEVTVISRADGLIKDDTLLQTPLNTSLLDGPNYHCLKCGHFFFALLKLKMHLIMEHKVLFCRLCDLLLESHEQREQHDLRVHMDYTCEICQEKILGDTNEHYSMLHNAVVCKYCDVLLHPSESYGKHLIEKHYANENFLQMDDLDEFVTDIVGSQYFCNLCEKTRYKELFGHFAYYHKINAYYLSVIFSERSIEVRLNKIHSSAEAQKTSPPINNTQQNTICPVCKCKYNKAIPKRIHRVYCENYMPCVYCLKVYEDSNSLTNHVNNMHETITCALECEAKLKPQYLEKHLEEVHQSFTCSFCDEYLCEPNEHMKFHNVIEENLPITEPLKQSESKITCTACETNIVGNLREIFFHFFDHHRFSRNKIMLLLCSSNVRINKYFSEDHSHSESDSEIKEQDEYSTDYVCKADFDPKFVRCLFDYALLSANSQNIFCGYCDMKFDNEILHLGHMYDKHGFKFDDNVLKCELCNPDNKPYIMEIHLKHVLIKKEEKDEFKCRFCEKSFASGCEQDKHELVAHLDDNKADFFTCFTCDTSFPSLRSLVEHKTVDENDCPPYTDITYQCTICAVVFVTMDDVRDHFKIVHSKLTVFHCPKQDCHKIFAVKKYAKMHYKNVHNRGLSNNLYCETCSRTFSNQKSYLLHVNRSHTRGYKCIICKETFQTFEHRKHHYTTIHPGEILFECSKCQRTFLSKTALYIHAKLHTEETSICSYCGKEFTRRDSYKEHLLIHIGPKHQCPHCPRAFTQKSNLRRHLRLHTGEKPYSCPYCPKKFSDKGACNSHLSVHTRESVCYCEVCGKKFSKPSKLKYHMKRHTGEGLLKCEICNRAFTAQCDLRKHMDTHDQRSQIVCGCGRSFSSQQYLLRHVKVVHDPNREKVRKPAKKLNFYQCLLCNNIYSLGPIVVKHIKTVHKITEGKEYKKHVRKLEPEETAIFTPVDQEHVEQNSPSDNQALEDLGVNVEQESDEACAPPNKANYRNEKPKKIVKCPDSDQNDDEDA